MKSLRQRVHQRAHLGPSGHAHVSRQRRMALWLTIFSAIRTLAWVICMLVIVAHWAGVGGGFVHSFIALSGSVVFVTFISFYCNAATDAANLMAGIAALFSADSHATAVRAGKTLAADFTSLEGDIARLADLQPGPEATALAAEIRQRLAAPA
jgi:hypothetical protein